jgi:hypothetical protein
MAGGFVDLIVPGRHSRRLMLAGLQRMSLLALLMLVAQYGLGIVLNLYVTVPSADAHAGILRVIVTGPLTLTLHVLLGLGLVGTAIVLLVRAVTVGDRRFAVLAAGGLTAIGGAFAAGEIFVRNGQQFASAAMAILTGVALLCYIGTLTLASTAYRQVAHHRRRAMGVDEPDEDDTDPWPPDYDDTDLESAWPPDYDDSDPPWLRDLAEKSGPSWRAGRDDTSGPAWPSDYDYDSGPALVQGLDEKSDPPWWQRRPPRLPDRGEESGPRRPRRDGPARLPDGGEESGPPWWERQNGSGLAWLPDLDDSDPSPQPDRDLDDAELGLVWTPDLDIPAPRPSWPDSGRSWSAPPGAR